MIDAQQLRILQLVTCCFMTGLIWVIQLVHYPSFVYATRESFTAFHDFHSTRITWIVGPVMTLELVTAVALCLSSAASAFWWLNLGGVMAIWACTAFLSVPYHNQLSAAFSAEAASALVTTNWPRTILWSLRMVALAVASARP
jgi:hypothetical protein